MKSFISVNASMRKMLIPVVLIGLPELLREFAEFRLLIYGALLIVMMLVKPEGSVAV